MKAWRGLVAAALAISALAAGAAPLPPATAAALGHAGEIADLSQTLDDLVRAGEESPRGAIDALLEIEHLGLPASPAQRRALTLSIGIVAARNGWDNDAHARIDALQALGDAGDPLAVADALLVRAEMENNAGHVQAAYEEARAALDHYTPACAIGPAQRPDCEYRAQFRALQLAEVGARGQGNLVVANNYAQKMLEVAKRAEDRAREAVTLSVSALIAERNADPTLANQLIAQAQRIARGENLPWLDVRVAVVDAMLHRNRQQFEATQQAYQQALAVAQGAGLARMAMHLRANLSDTFVFEHRPAEALAQIDLALPVARAHHDQEIERLLLHNAALAHLQLGRVKEAKAELAHVLDLWQRDTGPGQRASALHEFIDALEGAGDLPDALDLFHQEEKLEAEIRAVNTQAAVTEMRLRFDPEAQTRRIERLAGENRLKQAQIENQVLGRRLWMLAGAALSLLGALAVLMYLRMREVNRTLVEHEALLRAHTERDALTGLANRRQFREVMRVRDAEHRFRGALLMVDVDHFKRINDQHGHAGGDRVLVEVARRLATAVRANDLVARWGGEEFLVFAPGVEGGELEQLAERVRVSIGETPVTMHGGAGLGVTVSIGY
ncbi:MAG TPA: GGDEF domain-containing protein, partial [Burkholderiaceae bacterium]|nr:GGDEF domain-containing protein [Burkholderiaceae bacterium]